MNDGITTAKVLEAASALHALVDAGSPGNADPAKRGQDLRRDRRRFGPPTGNDKEMASPFLEAPRAADEPQAPRSPSPPAPTVEDVLAERQGTHGDFTDNARVIQSFKRILHTEVGWDRLSDVQREALHMIVHKIGRIISGNAEVRDHWDDIAGYAKLVSERIKV